MSATYNWAYKPSVTNKYGLTVPAGADTARPSGWCYVALFGNDATGNGSRNYPFRTITKAYTLSSSAGALIIVLGSGVYRETASITAGNQSNSILGDGDVTIDISYFGNLTNNLGQNGTMYNFKVIGNGVSVLFNVTNSVITPCYDVFFNGAFLCPSSSGCQLFFTNCIVANYSNSIICQYGTPATAGGKNCTYVNCNSIQIQAINIELYDSSIFYYCNISGNAQLKTTRYCLFFACNFKLSAVGTGGVLYPSTPAGYTYYSTIAALQAAYFAIYGTLSFTGCLVADPLFNNAAINDFSLSFASPAKNLSFFGTYVGAQSIAYQIKASATESTGGFDFSTNVNLTIANDSIILTDPTQNAEIKTKMIINAAGRQINKFPLYGFNADRNGQYIDSIADLGTSVKNAGDTLAVPASYLVETGAITYNAVLYQPGDRLTTVTGQTTFTTAVSGVLREILEAPERHTIKARFGDGGATVTAGDALTVGYWYYVVSGSITYDSTVYNGGSGFKAVDTNAFTGSGSVIVALSTEAYQHYEPGIQPTSNNTGDARTGSIVRGNGDPAYVRGGYGVQEFPINAKFIQLYYIINVANLKP